jgi:hypothetical protein
METGPNGISVRSIEALAPDLREKLLDSITAAVSAALTDAATGATRMLQTERQAFEAERQALRQEIAAALIALESERDMTRTVAAQLALVRAAKESAEASHIEAQNKTEQMSAEFANRVRALEQELEQGRAERAFLVKDLELERTERRRALAVLDSIRSAMGGGIAPPRQAFTAPTDVQAVEAPAPVSLGVERVTASESARPLKLVSSEPTPHNARWSEYATQLLDQIEASHQYDLESLERPSDVVARLTECLRMAREVFLTRFKDEPAAGGEFDRQIALLLDARSATTFARHLGIAWYPVSYPERTDTPSAVA